VNYNEGQGLVFITALSSINAKDLQCESLLQNLLQCVNYNKGQGLILITALSSTNATDLQCEILLENP
jgi:hypothetical protein